MAKAIKYYIVAAEALPEIFVKVAEEIGRAHV